MLPFDEILADLTRWEGRFKHLYLDVIGLVTTGIGNLVKTAGDAVALPFIDIRTGKPATANQKRAAWTAVSKQPPARRASFYAPVTALRLTDADVDALVKRRLENEFFPRIRKLLPDFDQYPAAAQRALVDIAYNCGVSGLGKFSHLLAACKAKDWAAAAKSCHRATSREERNTWTEQLFRSLGEEHV